MALRNDESTEQYVSSADSQNHYAHTGDEANSKRTSNSLRYPSTTTSHAVDVPVTNVGINLPADLAVRTYEQFDQMVERGLIYYDKSVEPEWVIDNDGFQVCIIALTHTHTYIYIYSNFYMFYITLAVFLNSPELSDP